jgi:hypothetical protein
MTLFVARACGCRLVRETRNSPCSATWHAHETSKLAFAMSLVPPLVLAAVLVWQGLRRIRSWHEADEIQRWAEHDIGVSLNGDGQVAELWCGDGVRLTDERLGEFAR